MTRILSAYGGYILDTEDGTPCHMDRGFLAFMEWATEAPKGSHAGTKEEFYTNIEIEADRRWCGGCPFRQACAERGELDEWTGLAGGKWLVDGERLTPAPEALKGVAA